MTSSLRRAVVLAAILIVTGLTIFLIKAISLDYPVTPGVKATVWDFEIYLEFEGQNEPARLEVFIPATGAERSLSEEEFYNGAFGLSVESDEDTGNRRAVWTYRYPSDRKVLRYSARTVGETTETPLAAKFRGEAPGEQPFESDPVKRQAFIVWIGDLRRRSADDASFAAMTLKAIFGPGSIGGAQSDEIAVLTKGMPDNIARLELARQTLRSQEIPARIANGVYLADSSRRAETHSWLEYHVDGKDQRHFPDGEPRRFFTIWYGSEPLVSTAGVSELDTQIALEARRNPAEALAHEAGGRLGFVNTLFSFGDLPLTTQLVYKVLVTIPVGITILVFLRVFVGVQTLGTFMPVLIGIAFRETALFNGLLLFTLLIGLGLALRFYLERLHLLLIPRLAVVIIFIVMTMAGVTILMTGANQSIGLSISLFPIVILTMTIERMSIVWEEDSASSAIKHGAGSLAVASLTYLAMTNREIEYLMYNFPELLLALMGLCVLMGRYTGLRLTELWRFRELGKS